MISAAHASCPRRSPAERAAPRRAFTLIELMIVIGIMAIIVATGVPPFVKAMRKEGLRKAVSDVVEGCSHARAQAVLHGAPAELLIRAEDGKIAVRPLATEAVQRSFGRVARLRTILGRRNPRHPRSRRSCPTTSR